MKQQKMLEEGNNGENGDLPLLRDLAVLSSLALVVARRTERRKMENRDKEGVFVSKVILIFISFTCDVFSLITRTITQRKNSPNHPEPTQPSSPNSNDSIPNYPN